MRRHLDRWLPPYAASMTLLAAYFGCRMVVLGALLARTRRFLVDRDQEGAEGWTYHYDPAVLVERGWGYALAVFVGEVGLPILVAVVPVLFFTAWWRSPPPRGKTPTDLSLE